MESAAPLWPRSNFLTSCLILGLLGKIVLSGIFLAPKGVLPWMGPKASEAATPAVPAPPEAQPAMPRMLSLMEKERQTLQSREMAVTTKEEQLRLLKQDVEERLKQLSSMQQRLLDFVEEEKRMQSEHNRHLVATLSAMPPERAGKLLEKMDEEVAVQLLRCLKGKEAGAILSLLPADRAAKLSQRLIR